MDSVLSVSTQTPTDDPGALPVTAGRPSHDPAHTPDVYTCLLVGGLQVGGGEGVGDK